MLSISKTVSAKALAIPGDTFSATIRLCNFESEPVMWVLKSKNNLVVHSNNYMESNTCSLTGLRIPNNILKDAFVAVDVKYKTSSRDSSFVLFQFNSFDSGSITKNMSADQMKNVNSIYAYMPVPIVGYTAVPIESTPKGSDKPVPFRIRNLSGGVIPDFVLCSGNKLDATGKSMCNDSYRLF